MGRNLHWSLSFASEGVSPSPDARADQSRPRSHPPPLQIWSGCAPGWTVEGLDLDPFGPFRVSQRVGWTADGSLTN
jgi:hypothetical protein